MKRFTPRGRCVAVRTFALGVLLVSARVARAQQPVQAGTAAGLGLGAMTEARFGESSLWNPALGGIFDGPMRSYSLLTGTGSLNDPRKAVDFYQFFPHLSRDSVGVIDGPRRTALESLLGAEVSRVSHDFALQWLGVQDREFTLAVTTYGHTDLRIPSRAARISTGDNVAITEGVSGADLQQAVTNPSREWLATVFSAARAKDMGMQPVLGRLWIGAATKVTLLHASSLGHWEYSAASDINAGTGGLPLDPSARTHAGDMGATYTDVLLSHAKMYGLDLGAVFNPTPPVLMSVALTNLFQKASVSTASQDLRQRKVGFAGLDSLGHTRSFGTDSVLNPSDAVRPWFADAEYLARSAKFTPMLRASMSLEAAVGRLMVGYAHRMQTFSALDAEDGTRLTLGWMAPRLPLRPRVTYSALFDGSSMIGLGIQQGWCGDRIALGSNLVRRVDGTRELQASIGWSRGELPCGMFR
jgi:hypothetical protein